MIANSTDPVIFVSLKNICRNFAFLNGKAREISHEGGQWPSAIPVIKSDAYGHGLVKVGAALLEKGGAEALAVGTVEEGVDLREGLRKLGAPENPILSLLGAYSAEEAEACAVHGITPVAQSLDQLEKLGRAAAKFSSAPIGIGVKLDTGMCRLGLKHGRTDGFLNALRSSKALRPQLFISHLAAADAPEEDGFTQQQLALFREELNKIRSVWPEVRASLLNSAGLLSHAALEKNLGALLGPHMSRPGMAIYGVSPLHRTGRHEAGEALVPAMRAAAPVMAVHDVPAGRSVSYGRTFKAEKDIRVAVIRAGYADGFSRGLSGKGELCLHGRRVPVLGRVCMQMHMVDVSALPEVKPGDLAFILGGEGESAISPYDLASAWGTIPYEVCCILGRNRRIYED